MQEEFNSNLKSTFNTSDNLISVYIHIPFCISKCEYCDFYSVPLNKSCTEKTIIPDSYIHSLCNEIKFRTNLYPEYICKSVYIGGGTPSLLTESQLTDIFECLKNNFSFTSDFTPEITIEVNPDDVTENLITTYEKIGINRISCGIQSMNDKVLKLVKRRAGAEDNKKALSILKKWPHKLSLDLISGLPEETEESFFDGLQQICNIKPHHISLYSLVVEEETPLGKKIVEGEQFYNFDFSDEMWIKGKDFLIQHGYKQYEVSNFALPDFECVHNKSYWQHQSYFGFGSGGTGTIYKADGTGFRWTNKPSYKDYIKFWENFNKFEKNDSLNFEKLIPEEKENIHIENSQFEFFMMGLRLFQGVKEKDFLKIFNQNIPEKYLKVFDKWEKYGRMEITGNPHQRNFKLNEKGMLFLNQILEDLI